MSGHFLKLHFCMFERSQVKHNSFLEYLSLIVKITWSKFDTNQNVFPCSKHSNPENH
jgi:hypothetical protein